MNTQFLVNLLKKLVYIRLAEEKICNLYSEQEMRCPVHLCIGQEASAVGVCANLTSEDIVFSNHRSHGHYLAKGGDLKTFFAEIYGKITGCSRGRGGSQHLADLYVSFIGSTPIVGGTIPLAAGAGFTQMMKKSKVISVSFMGDAATEEGVFHETLNFAKLKNLPVLFVCENNLYAVNTLLCERQPLRKINEIVKAHGLAVYEADGTDVIDVYEKSKKAIEQIRSGSGPAFVEIATYRYKEHCGPCDDYPECRPEKEVNEWKQRDSIKKLKEKMISEQLITTEEIMEMEKNINEEIDKAVDFAKSSEFPDENELNKYVYAD